MSLLDSGNQILTSYSPDLAYSFDHFAEESPMHVDAARRIHASCYDRLEFVKPGSIIDGFFADGIDKARGLNVDFTIGYPSGTNPISDRGRRGSYRSISTDSVQGLDALPSYQLCRPNISSEGHALLEKNTENIKEIAALSGEDGASVYFMLREAISKGMPNEERWFFGIVSSTFDKFGAMFGPDAIKQIGEPTAIPDDRVSDHIRIVPAYVDTRQFVDTLARNFLAAKDEKSRRKIGGSLLFCVEALDKSDLSIRTKLTVSAIKAFQKTVGRCKDA